MKSLRMLLSIFAIVFLMGVPVSIHAEVWKGLDDSVKEIAKQHGHAAREPYINTDQGDMLLFVFLIAGAVGGFIIGYNWKILFGPRTESKPDLISSSPGS